jgi:hypothetical protein
MKLIGHELDLLDDGATSALLAMAEFFSSLPTPSKGK